jgi:NADP-dependent aldehyde dehydrogenase
MTSSFNPRNGQSTPALPQTSPDEVAGVVAAAAAALDRFTRPVAYQDVPDQALPPALREGNPWGLPRRVDGILSL